MTLPLILQMITDAFWRFEHIFVPEDSLWGHILFLLIIWGLVFFIFFTLRLRTEQDKKHFEEIYDFDTAACAKHSLVLFVPVWLIAGLVFPGSLQHPYLLIGLSFIANLIAYYIFANKDYCEEEEFRGFWFSWSLYQPALWLSFDLSGEMNGIVYAVILWILTLSFELMFKEVSNNEQIEKFHKMNLSIIETDEQEEEYFKWWANNGTVR